MYGRLARAYPAIATTGSFLDDLKLQARLASCVGKCLDPPVVLVAPAIQADLLNTRAKSRELPPSYPPELPRPVPAVLRRSPRSPRSRVLAETNVRRATSSMIWQ